MQPDNPYAPPAAVEAPVLTAHVTPEPAPQWKRFVNFLIDNFTTAVISNCAGFIFGVSYALSRPDPTAPITPDQEVTLNLIGMAIGLTLALAYYTFTEAVMQRTLGKLVTGTRVVTADGGRPTVGQIVGRSFARFIPFEAFSFLGGNGFPVGWHDSLSRTRVVNTR